MTSVPKRRKNETEPGTFRFEEQPDGFDKEPVPGEEDLAPLIFRGEPIGKYYNSHDCGIIQIQESENLPAETIAGAVGHIKEGAFLRVIWLFDRFDDKRFRSHLESIIKDQNTIRTVSTVIHNQYGIIDVA